MNGGEILKRIVLWTVSLIMLILTILSIGAAITVTGSGALDLSNIARGVFIVIAVVCGPIVLLTARKAIKSK